MDEILIIIPARGGSKGVPRKNVRLLHGKPLIAHTIEAALAAQLDKRVIVSTEDEEIAAAARAAGAEIPFMRPAALAQDQTSSYAVIDHVLDEWVKQSHPEPRYVMLLQPTSPFRTTEDIEGLAGVIQEEKCELAYTVTEVDEHPLFMSTINHEGRLIPFMENTQKISRRQDLPTLYRINGAGYICTLQAWRQYRSFIAMQDVCPYVMPVIRSVDIDTELDWKLAEIVAGEVFR